MRQHRATGLPVSAAGAGSVRAIGFSAGAVFVTALVLSAMAAGCSGSEPSETTAGGGAGTTVTTARALPPIDLRAPDTFQTASFAFG